MITLMIRCKMAIMIQVCLGENINLLKGDAVLAFTYAKIYYRGGGWYAVSGYAADGSDVHRVITHVKELKVGRCVECGGKPVDALSKDGWCEFCEEAFQMEFI